MTAKRLAAAALTGLPALGLLLSLGATSALAGQPEGLYEIDPANPPTRELTPDEQLLHHADPAEPQLPGDFIEGVYSAEPGCVSGYQPNDDRLYLTREGISGLAYGCDFLSLESSGDPSVVIAQARCSKSPAGTIDLIRVSAIDANLGPASEVLVEFEDGRAPTPYFSCPGE